MELQPRVDIYWAFEGVVSAYVQLTLDVTVTIAPSAWNCAHAGFGMLCLVLCIRYTLPPSPHCS